MENNTVTYKHLEELPLEGKFPVIWLASWYPSVTTPVNGDFIQRHADALGMFMPLLVIHAIHVQDLDADTCYALTQRGQVTEVALYFKQEEPVGFFDRLQYNLKFYKSTRDLLNHVVKLCGKPSAFHVHVPMKMGRLAIWAKRSIGVPYVVSEHSSKYIGNAEDSFHRRSILYRMGVKQVFRKAEAVTNVSQALGEILKQRFGLKEVKVIRNVVDSAVFRYRGKNVGVKFRFLHASTLKGQKNIEGMLRAFDGLYRMRQDFELLVIGGTLPIHHQRPWLCCVGEVAHRQVATHMADADAFVLFSREENFPCVIIEALCSGLPVVTSDAGGCAEAIHNGNGILVPSENEKALLGALNAMISDRDLYNRAAISEQAASLYSYQVIGQQFMDLYRQLGYIS